MLRALHSIADLRVRAAALASRLSRDAVGDLDGIVRAAENGSGPDRDVLLAFVHARVTRDDLPILALAEAARERGLVAAERVLGDDDATREIAKLGRLPEPLLPARSLHWLRHDPRFGSLGTRRITTPIRERLLRDPRAEVIRRLIELEGTRLADVLRLASRRPSTKEIARTIAGSRWLSEHAVREALVRNPFTERWLAFALSPTVSANRNSARLR